MVDIHFSLSDRIRYYWPHPRIRQSVEKLIANLSTTSLPLGLIAATPQNLIIDKIQDVLRAYRFGCTPEHV